ncbi:hypothetical protein C2845_PM13G08400 [Panicum miliaceum]|uniref:Uncharacterized protein n=1 Tax=Panicum miliaceum TaxID=4540 RepID=A0A3L6RKJ2_PANMI|nr:hypothetical protein C2845_PM13G08400 [Panicum miliaceum]
MGACNTWPDGDKWWRSRVGLHATAAAGEAGEPRRMHEPDRHARARRDVRTAPGKEKPKLCTDLAVHVCIYSFDRRNVSPEDAVPAARAPWLDTCVQDTLPSHVP